jgi:hypothetical protein
MTGSIVAGRVFGPPGSGSGSGSISKRYGLDPAPDPGPPIIQKKTFISSVFVNSF